MEVEDADSVVFGQVIQQLLVASDIFLGHLPVYF